MDDSGFVSTGYPAEVYAFRIYHEGVEVSRSRRKQMRTLHLQNLGILSDIGSIVSGTHFIIYILLIDIHSDGVGEGGVAHLLR